MRTNAGTCKCTPAPLHPCIPAPTATQTFDDHWRCCCVWSCIHTNTHACIHTTPTLSTQHSWRITRGGVTQKREYSPQCISATSLSATSVSATGLSATAFRRLFPYSLTRHKTKLCRNLQHMSGTRTHICTRQMDAPKIPMLLIQMLLNGRRSIHDLSVIVLSNRST